MTATSPQFEWYLAREGQQYGPLSDVELKKFVDLGHLKETDLVWRQGFAEWQSAAILFPPTNTAPGRPAPAAAPRTGTAAATQPASSGPMRSPTGPDPRARTSFDRNAPSAPSSSSAGRPQDGPGFGRPAQPSAGNPAAQTAPARGADTTRGRPANPASNARAQESPRAAQLGEPRTGGGAAGTRGSAAQPQTLGGNAPYPDKGGDRRPAQPAKRGRLGLYLASAAVVAALAGGGWFALQNLDISSILPAGLMSGGNTPAYGGDLSASPLKTAGDTVEAIDSSFQQTALWRVVKQNFPDWYGERLQDAQKLKSENRDETAVAKQLSEGLVALRRKHAAKALAASPKRLVAVAQSFLDNLNALSKHSTEACYGFISNGETNPIVLNLMLGSRLTAPLQHQVTSVFEAIGEGTKSPQNYMPPRKTDYDLLAQELTARGWSQADLQLFSDPRALSRASQEQVCKMVQDWFAAQIAIKDGEVQTRLLVESLRPVVAG